MRKVFTTLAAAAALGTAALVAAPVANADVTTADTHPELATFTTAPAASIQAAGDGTPAGAVQWYKNHQGSTAYQGLCEKAAENAYGTTGVWASANAHWNGASPKHTTGTPPAGSFVYWNISAYGHVGIADGNGGFYASSVGGAIGHGSSVSYFTNYRGWTPGAVPHQ
ncbi:CHAP domain-containing protein [Amycolatopsis sp. OK19-0408]|uniref:CHAP domain-containing protein n=1 Tax=Amycolatopsis iheyensis TaxID=2945988 RepID=A0A9X2N4C9_9PSEU|nr:CHAP domain-containing protein [Amycolatopsis iheyensis]MCR6481799.1 CHAP domain-containing protein [Amycolatopsis iheyensis]